jgi:hypothetical protein
MSLGVSTLVRREYDDCDYTENLERDDLHWLKRFHREYLNADFSTGQPLHITRKICYDANNARNRDLYSIAKCTGNLLLCDPIPYFQFNTNPDLYEDHLIAQIDTN